MNSYFQLPFKLPFTLLPLRGLVIPAALLLWWEYESHIDAAHAFTFVPLESIASSFVTSLTNGDLFFNWWASVVRTMTGFVVGAGLGIFLGASMNFSLWIDRLVNPIYHAIRQVPLLGWIPLISLWFGNGEYSKLFIVALASFYPTVLNTYEGLRNVDEKYLAVAQVLKLTRFQVLWRVTYPNALPNIYAGLMQATAFAWLSSIGSEFFFNPGPGLGTMMMNGQSSFHMDIVMLTVVAISLTGFGMNTLLFQLSRRSLRWRNTR